jgi:hypothetical protein
MGDCVVIVQDIGGEYDGHGEWLDLRDPEALEEERRADTHPDVCD